MATDNTDPIPNLLDSLDLVDEAIGLVQVALNHNPGADDARTLNQQALRLEAERGVLQAEIDAAADASPAQGPTPAQHAAIVALTVQVEAAANANAATSQAIALASQALGLITQVVTT